MKGLSGKAGLVFLLAFFAILLTATFGLSQGYDLWFHLANGRFISETGTIPHREPFLFSSPRHPEYYFTNYEWLFGTILWNIFTRWGYSGIDLLRTLVIFAGFLLLTLDCFRRLSDLRNPSRGAVFLPALLFLGFAGIFFRFEPRPQMFSAMFLAFVGAFRHEVRGRAGFGALLSAALVVLWANIHIEVFLGILLLGLSIPEKAFLGNREGLRKCLPEAASLAAALGVLFLTPAGRGLFFQGMEYASREAFIRDFGLYNVELVPFGLEVFGEPFGKLVLVGIIGFLGWLHRTGEVPPETPSFLAFVALPFISVRFAYPSTIVILPIAFGWACSLLDTIRAPRGGECGRKARMAQSLRTPPGRRGVWVMQSALLVLFPLQLGLQGPRFFGTHPVVALSATRPAGDVYHFSCNVPVGALRFLRKLGVSGPLFHPEMWGNFILFHDLRDKARLIDEEPAGRPGAPSIVYQAPETGLSPRTRAFINGMHQTYHRDLMRDYLLILTDPGQRDRLITEYGFKAAILPYPESRDDHFFGLSRFFQSSPAWKLAYWDDLSIVYLSAGQASSTPPDPLFGPLVDPSLFHVSPQALNSSASLDILGELLRAKTAFGEEGILITRFWIAQMMSSGKDWVRACREYQEILGINPRSFSALFQMGVSCHHSGKAEQSIAALERARSLKSDSPPVLYNLAIAYLAASRPDKAVENLENCLDIDPEFPPARKLMATIESGPTIGK